MLIPSIQPIDSGHFRAMVDQRLLQPVSTSSYFQFYRQISQHQHMLQDFIRTSTYQRAINSNRSDFAGKVVLDVGAGSAILSFFAARAGATKVYAIEASAMAEHARHLVRANRLDHVITVITGKVEEIELPQKVDVIVSEPIGHMLYNDRMMETFLHAKKWLAEGGKMYPSLARLHVAPYQDAVLFTEQWQRASFWCRRKFFGIDLSSLGWSALAEYFQQPVVGPFDSRCCLSESVQHICQFLEAHESDLHRITIPLWFQVLETGFCHGLAFWFDVEFAGSDQHVWLSTAPAEPLTHWFQVRSLLVHPMPVQEGQLISGEVLMVARDE